MCRVMLANKAGVMSFHKWLLDHPTAASATTSYKGYYTIPSTKTRVKDEVSTGLLSWLEKMEDCLGGHGNGLALLKGTEVIALVKGTKLTVETTVQMLLSYDYDWAVWHTRLTSSGTTNDANCHPFHYAANKHELVWCMNGTESEYTRVGKYLGNITDTEVIGRIAVELNIPLPEFFDNFNSVFVGTLDGKPFAVRNSGALVRYKTQDENAILFCSQLPKEVETFLPTGYVWNNGTEISVPRATVTTYSSNKWWTDDFDDFDTRRSTHAVHSGKSKTNAYALDTAYTLNVGKESKVADKAKGFIEAHRKAVSELMPRTANSTPWYSIWSGSYAGMLVGKIPNVVELTAIVDKLEKAPTYDKLSEQMKGLFTQLVCELSSRRTQKHTYSGVALPVVPDTIVALIRGVPSISEVKQDMKVFLSAVMKDKEVSAFIQPYLPLLDRLVELHEKKNVMKFQISNLIAYIMLSIDDISYYVPELLEENPGLCGDETQENKLDEDDGEPSETVVPIVLHATGKKSEKTMH